MGAARFTVICDECVRIEWSASGRFVDEPSLFAPERGSVRRVVIAEDARGAPGAVIETRRVRMEYRPDGRPLGATNLSAAVRLDAEGGRSRTAFWHPGDRNERNLGGTVETLDGVRGPVPIGEGLLARDGWHVIDDSHGHLLVDGWVAARAWRGVPEGNRDWYLFAYGDDYAAALRALARVSGPVPVPRRCMLGSWYSRYWPHTSAEFRGIVEDYRARGFPLDVLVLDMDWHSASARDEWTGWSWNRELLPDAEELMTWLHGQGVEVALNLHPAEGVGPQEERYEAFMRAQGADPHTGERLAFDAGNRKYMQALFNEVLAPLEAGERGPRGEVRGEDMAAGGVGFWWLDWQQEKWAPSVPGLTNLAWLNDQFFRHTARGGRRGASLSRWAGLGFGDHRRPMHFSGDAHTGWAMLAFQVPFTVAAGNAGCFYWSHDIGGHFGPRLEECAARWVWFGALSAALRMHSARSAELDRRPWVFAEPYAGAMRKAFVLRAQLMPYLDGAAHECERDGLPLLRPMYLAWAREERAYRVPGQYLLGRDLLGAPVVRAGIGEGCVAWTPMWFPPADERAAQGGAWFNWFTGERFEAGAEVAAAAAIDEVPMFVRGGVPVATRPFAARPASEAITELVVRVFPGEAGAVHERELHEDDGDTTGYRRGEARRTPIRATWRAGADGGVLLALQVGPSEGAYPGAVESRALIVEVGGAVRVSDVRVDGREGATVEADESGLIRVRAGEAGVGVIRRVEAMVVPRPADRDEAVRRRRVEGLLGEALPAGELREAVAAACAEGEGGAAERVAGLLAAGAGIGAWPETDAPAGVGRPDAVRVCDPLRWIDGERVEAAIVERVGPVGAAERGVAGGVLGLAAGAAGIPLPPQELEEPPWGLRAVRLARLRFELAGRRITHEVEVESRLRPLAGFVAVGPFAWDWRRPIHEQVFGPEARAFDVTERFTAMGGSPVGWTAARRGDKWEVDFRATYPHARGLAYAAATIVSEWPQRALLHLESGDKLEAWVNGTKVFSQDGHDTAAAALGRAEVRLPAGRSVLLIKTSDGGGGWGFTARLEGESEVEVTEGVRG